MAELRPGALTIFETLAPGERVVVRLAVGVGSVGVMLDLRAPATTRNATVRALVVWSGLIVVAVAWGRVLVVTHHDLVLAAPPFWSPFRFHPTARVIPSLLVAYGVVRLAPHAARELAWRPLLAVTAIGGALWAVAVAVIDSIDGINALTDPLRFSRNDYLQTARGIGSLHVFLSRFVGVIDSYPQNTKGHPPGMVVIEWLLDKIGLASPGWSAALSVAGGVAAGIAVLVAVREVAGEDAARATAPFMVLVPAVIWWQTADAFFAGVAAWSVTALVLASGRRDARALGLALAGGLGFGVTAFLSYGLVLLVVIPVTVCVVRRRVSLLPAAALGALAVFAAFAALGFSWFAGFMATRHAVLDRSRDPPSLFVLPLRRSRAVGHRDGSGRSRRARPPARPPTVAARRRGDRGRRARRPQWYVQGGGRTNLVALRALVGAGDGSAVGAATVRARAAVADGPSCLHTDRGRDDLVAMVTTGAHVLVVEDDPTVREVVVRYLEREGIDVTAVGDGESALVEAELRWPDLVVLDLMLPALDGFEVCRRLRRDRAGPGDHVDRTRRRGRPGDGVGARSRRLRVEAVLAT